METIDEGDYYYHFEEKVRLLRVANEYLVHLTDDARASDVIDRLTTAGGALSNFTASVSVNSPGVILKLSKSQTDEPSQEAMDAAVKPIEGVAWMAPVFVGADTGSHSYLTDDMSVALAPGVDPETFFATGFSSWRRFFANQYIATVSDGGGMGALELANELSADPRVEWAAPSFYSDFRVDSIPDDPLFGSQWSLNNTGQTGAQVDADGDLPGAWDVTTGSTNIIVAVLDNGVQTNHPDLPIFVNAGEIAGNGVDDDLNGYIDDVNGWDFAGDPTGVPLGSVPDNNPNPTTDDDNHGTAVAGVVAALGDNGVGVTGAAQDVRILPVKIARDDTGGGGGFIAPEQIAKAVYYAAGIVIDGSGNPTGATWRAADILVNSWGGGMADPVLTAAFDYVQTHGRAGLGVASFNASGNAAAGIVPQLNYYTVTIPGAVPGNWQFEWQYTKNGSNAAGDDSAWLGNIQFPNGATQRFDTLGFPSGWSTSGNANWSVIDDPSHTYGTGRYVAKAGTIGNNQSSNLRSPTINVTTTGSLTFSYWVSSEAGFDGLRLFASYNGGSFEEAWNFSGVPLVTSNVQYPANLASTIAVGASTDWDYRSHYSQYGSALDVVAPSDGGYAAITTTDRTETAGYNSTAGTAGNYTSTFNGTSAATPLAAGIAALMLSKNWNLTTSQIRMLLRTTADKIGGNNGQTAYTNGFNQYYGYGRVNAAAALAATPTELIGDNNFDNVVTGLDALLVINNQGTRGPIGDTDHNHIVDLVDDYNLVFAHLLETGTFPTMPDMVDGSDTGILISDNITSNTTPEFTVTGPAGWYVELYVGGVLQGSHQLAVGESAHNFTTTELTPGMYNVTAKVSENAALAAAGLSNLSAPLFVTIDTQLPTTPGSLNLTVTDTGISSIDNITSDTTPEFTWTASNGTGTAIVRYWWAVDDPTPVGDGTIVLSSSALTAMPTVAHGNHTFYVVAEDEAGNFSTTASLPFTIDTQAPTSPGSLDLDTLSDSGILPDDNVTNDTTPQFMWSAANGTGSAIVRYWWAVDNSTPAIGGTSTTSLMATPTLQQGSASHIFYVAAEDRAGNISATVSLSFTIDTVAPKVSQVFLDSSAWTSPDFYDRLVAGDRGTSDGFWIPGAANQLNTVWFSNVDRIVVQFNEDVDVQQADLSLSGGPSVNGLTYNDLTYTARWTLSGSIGNASLTLTLEGNAGSAVQDVAGNKLDGEWTNGADAYPSGNGTAAGSFVFNFNVLPGDVNQDGTVDIFDVNVVSANWDTPGGPIGDINGDASVDIFDVNLISAYWGTSNGGGGGGESAMMFVAFHVALAAYLKQIALVRQDKALLAWLEENSAEDLGQDIEDIGTDTSAKEVEQIQTTLDSFFAGLNKYQVLTSEE